jgi:hypothetical protein
VNFRKNASFLLCSLIQSNCFTSRKSRHPLSTRPHNRGTHRKTLLLFIQGDSSHSGSQSNIITLAGLTASAVTLTSSQPSLGDGFPDLVTADLSDNTVSVLLGNGDASFRPALRFQTGRSPESLGVSDFNGDGILDLAVANTQNSTVSILLIGSELMFIVSLSRMTSVRGSALTVGSFTALKIGSFAGPCCPGG